MCEWANFDTYLTILGIISQFCESLRNRKYLNMKDVTITEWSSYNFVQWHSNYLFPFLQFWWEPWQQRRKLLYNFSKPQWSTTGYCFKCHSSSKRDQACHSLSPYSREGPGGVSEDDAPHPRELCSLRVPGTARSQEKLQMSCDGLGHFCAVRGVVQQEQHRAEQQLLHWQGVLAVGWHTHSKAF